MMLPSGETVLTDERFFVVRVNSQEADVTGWSNNEQHFTQRHHWRTKEEIEQSSETIFSHDLIIKSMQLK